MSTAGSSQIRVLKIAGSPRCPGRFPTFDVIHAQHLDGISLRIPDVLEVVYVLNEDFRAEARRRAPHAPCIASVPAE